MLKIKMPNESWRPDRSSVIPLFKQIYDFIICKISSGEWSIGSKLPTQLEMAKVFEVNRSTILEVYDELKSKGLVESKKSSGTIIINNTWSILTLNAPPDWGKKISESIHEPNLDIIKIINDAEPKKGLIRLGAGELARDMMPSKYIKNILLKLTDEITYMGYEESKGLLVLREEIAKYLKKRGIDTDPSKILIVSGALQALNLISMGLLHRGSTILTEKPSYLQSLTLFDSHRINLSGVEMDKDGIQLDGVTKKSVTKKPELLYVIPNYHNPTGTLMSNKRRKDLLMLCERERLAIIEDDVYGELWFDNPPPNPIKSEDKNGTVLYVGSVSKTLSAGMRVGWIVGNENVIDRLADIKMQTDYGSSNVSQWMCYEFFRSGAYEKFLGELRSELKLKRDLTIKLLETHFKDIATWKIPTGGLYIWLKLKIYVPPYKLFEKCYDEDIVINTGNLYDDSDKSSLRISFAYASRKELEQGLLKLANIIKDYK
jgi:GntR family transcriptional regulator of abcA and norABC